MSNSFNNERFKYLLIISPERAIEYLYRYYYDSLLNISQRKTRDSEASEDIVNEALSEVWKKRHWLRQKKDLLIGPYLIGIVKNKSIDFYKSKVRLDQTFAKYLWSEQPNADHSKEAEIISSERNKIVRDIVSTLSPREKECISMKFFDGMSVEAIAHRLKISEKAVHKNLSSGIKRMQKYKSSIY